MMFLRQSTVVVVPLGPFVDSTDGFTPETALAISGADLRLRKHNDDWITLPASGSPTGAYHRENGWYDVELSASATDTLGPLKIACYEAGALPVWIDATVLPQQVYDSLIGGTDTLDVSVTSMGANSVTASALATDAVDEIVDGVWDEILTGATHNIASSAGRRLRQIASLVIVDSSVNDAAATTTSFITALTSAVNDFYADQLIVFTSGALNGQARPIASYNGTTKAITVSEALTSAPANGDTFTLQATHIHPVEQIATTVWASGTRTITSLDEDTTTVDLDATVRAAVGLASANLDTQLTAIDDAIDTEVAAIKAKTDLLNFTSGNVHADIKAVIADPVQASSTKTTNWGGT